MEKYEFQCAKPIFYPWTDDEAVIRRGEAVNHYGFYIPYVCEGSIDKAVLALTARNAYRLYINGEVVMHGPARTAHGYCRVDEIDVTKHLCMGENHIGVEVMVYGDVYDRYSNDSTLEEGLFVGELTVNGQVALATGVSAWKVTRLTSRAPHSQRLSHSREASEIYFMDEQYALWDLGLVDYADAVAVKGQEPTYLPHEALKPTLAEHAFTQLVEFGSCYIDEHKPLTSLFYEKNNPYYHALSEFPLEDCRRTVEQVYNGVNLQRAPDSLLLEGEEDKYLLFDGGESRVGFIKVSFECAHDGIVDIVHSELMELDGSFAYDHDTVTRLHVKAGACGFIAMEPCLARYVKIYFRGVGDVQLFGVSMLEYSYPDEMRSGFQCSDDEINRLYNAAKKTLLLNTMDIFMDCPERERGGWLCDSLWTARAAHMMLSDPRVEREFIENFLLTPCDMFHGFFPEVYPGLKPDYGAMTGITTWSFWLMCELCEYTARTGDTYLRDTYAHRVEAFVKGSSAFMGESGLLENLPWLFIDWSLSNDSLYQQPISTPANALYAYMLTQLGELYGRKDWIEKGQGIRSILRLAIIGDSELGLASLRTFSDSFKTDDHGKLIPSGKVSESGLVTSLWAGLFLPGEAPLLEENLFNRMGPAPLYAADPNIGQSQLFIGLCIRLDLLSRFGACEQMYRDLLAIYLPQLKEGPGTLWEVRDISASSRCHGFTSHAGVHLMRDVLGLGIPQVCGHGYNVTITPCICGLRWARGTMETPRGLISVNWQYDGKSFVLRASLPTGFTYDVQLPREVRCLDQSKVFVDISVRPER